MRKVIEIIGVADFPDYSRTYAVVDDGSEVVGFGKDFKVGDLVEVFFDEKWNTVKMRKKPKAT